MADFSFLGEGGGPERATFDGRDGVYKHNGGKIELKGKYVFEAYDMRGGNIKWNGPGQAPDEYLDPVYPKDETRPRSALPHAEPVVNKFTGKPEDAYRPILKAPVRDLETGETTVLIYRNITAITAVNNFVKTLRKLPADTLAIVEIGATNVKTKYGTLPVPNFSVVGTTGPTEGPDFDDDVGL